MCNRREAGQRGCGVFLIGHGKRACGVYDCKEDGERGNGVCARMCVSAGRQKKRVQVFASERGRCT